MTHQPLPTHPQERSFVARGLRFGGLCWPGEEGPPVVLIHGWLDQAAIWLGVAPALGRPVYALDLRGHGRSAHAAPGDSPHFAEYLADLDQLLDVIAAEHPGPVDLVGHSLGGTITSMYAGLRPERVRRLVLVDGLGLADGLDAGVDRLVAFLDGVRLPLNPRPMRDLDEATSRLRDRLSGWDPAQVALYVNRHVVARDGRLYWSYDERLRRRFAAPYRQDLHLNVLARVAAPTLLLVPEHGPFGADDRERLERAIPHARRVMVPGTTHNLHVEAPGEVGRRIAAFLRSEGSGYDALGASGLDMPP